MKIHTDNPYRDIWTAYDYSNYEPGDPQGQGMSEQAAIDSLVEQLLEQEYERGWRDACRKHGVKDDAS
jgi:hypothetical protein